MKEISNDILNALTSIGYPVSDEGKKMLNSVLQKMTEIHSDEMAEETLLEQIDNLHSAQYNLGRTILFKSLVDSKTPEDANVLAVVFNSSFTLEDIGNELGKSLQENVECDTWVALKQVMSSL